MSAGWRVEKHYGFGAASVPLVAHRHRHPIRPDGLLIGLRRAATEAQHEEKALRRKLVWIPLSIFATFVSINTLLEILNPPKDVSSVEIVMLEDLPLPPEVEIEIPEELIAIPPEPPPIVQAPPPEPQIAQLPVPPTVEIRSIERPRPTPPPARKIERRAPPQQVVAAPTPKRTPPEIRLEAMRDLAMPTDAPRRERIRVSKTVIPRERARLDVQPAAAIQRSEPQPPPQTRRTRPPAAPQPQPSHAPLPLPAMERTAELPDEPAATRQPQRFAVVTKRSTTARPAIDTAPLIPSANPIPEDAPLAALRSPRPSPPKARSAAPPKTAAPQFGAPLPVPDDSAQRVLPARRATPSPAATSRPGADQPDLAMPNRGERKATLPGALGDSSRSERVVPAAISEAPRMSPSLQGVALGSLAACVSDREEDSLKRKLVAAVTTQSECASAAGTYRFIETKNLNAFLMWIDKASSRPVGDRCVELNHALDCLAQTRTKEPRRR